ncbi:hypothetical protein GH714_043934 [Hevea brasiliensis]|uniref:Integrase zinc-binding domain-containing protein n=1 Tax=Hevea brasiliensis TaxID=3981 RepID=A0A6A6JYC9_HEVBR|nr:hypothetical protein GH714_043934 [Hevea brasiliensis]
MAHDLFAKNLLGLAKEGKTRRFWEQDGLIYTIGSRLFIPRWGNLRKELLKECHDSMWAGHPGMQRTMALISRSYYWPRMEEDVEGYVRTCLVCQQDKVEQRQPAGLLEPLPTPERPWDSVTMDFISALPKSDGCGSIMVVVDRLSKYGTFIAAPRDCTADEAARCFQACCELARPSQAVSCPMELTSVNLYRINQVAFLRDGVARTKPRRAEASRQARRSFRYRLDVWADGGSCHPSARITFRIREHSDIPWATAASEACLEHGCRYGVRLAP